MLHDSLKWVTLEDLLKIEEYALSARRYDPKPFVPTYGNYRNLPFVEGRKQHMFNMRLRARINSSLEHSFKKKGYFICTQ